MGTGSTVASAALIAWFTARTPAEVTGLRTGIDDDTLVLKVAVIEDALRRTRRSVEPADSLAVLASLGGLEIAALAGFIVGGAAARVPVLVDGVSSAAALLVAAELCPLAPAYAFVAHRCVEPGSAGVLDHLHLRPLLDHDIRIGACLALPVLQTASRLLGETATVDQAGVAARNQPA